MGADLLLQLLDQHKQVTSDFSHKQNTVKRVRAICRRHVARVLALGATLAGIHDVRILSDLSYKL